MADVDGNGANKPPELFSFGEFGVGGAYPGGFVEYLGEPSQVAAEGRPLTVAAEVGREGGESGAVREAARVVFKSVGEGEFATKL